MDTIIVRIAPPEKADARVITKLIEEIQDLLRDNWVLGRKREEADFLFDVEFFIAEWLYKRVTVLVIRNMDNIAVGYAISQRIADISANERINLITDFYVTASIERQAQLEKVINNLKGLFPEERVGLWLEKTLPPHAYGVDSSPAGVVRVV